MSDLLSQMPLAVPTVSFVVPFCKRTLTTEEVLRVQHDIGLRSALVEPKVYVVRFRTKHNGGIGVPGGRLKFQSNTPLQQFEDEGGEELGMAFKEWQAMPFTVRCRPGRDVRARIAPSKYAHGDPIPESVAGLPAEMFAAHHCIDIVYLALGISIDPSSLVPSDTIEVAEIQLLDLTGPLPPLPISDDKLLLEAVRDWCEGKFTRPPMLLHG